MVRPNALRSRACFTEASIISRAEPMQPEARDRRPVLRISMAILKPPPRLPTAGAAPGTRTLSKPTSTVLLPRMPILCMGGVVETPSRSRLTRKQEMAWVGLSVGSLSVRAKNGEHLAEAAVGDPLLAAVDHPDIIGGVVDRLGGHGGSVRSGAGLGQGIRPDPFAGGHLGQELLLLLLRAVHDDSLDADGLVAAHHGGGGGAVATHRLHEPAVRSCGEARAAVLLGHGEAQDAPARPAGR